MPINRFSALNLLYELDLQSDEQAAAFLEEPRGAGRCHPHVGRCRHLGGRARTLRDVFQGYTPQAVGAWIPPELDKSVASRVPTRTNDDDPLFRRQVPVDARAQVSPRCSNVCSTTRISICCWGWNIARPRPPFPRSPRFHWPDRRIFDHRYGKLPTGRSASSTRPSTPNGSQQRRRW